MREHPHYTMQKDNRSKILGYTVIFLVCIWFLKCVVGDRDSPTVANAKQESAIGKLKEDAFIIAKYFIKVNLKSPSSASFPWYDESYVMFERDNIYLVRAYVDAQNSFGAMIRNNWYCELRYKGFGNTLDYANWELMTYELYQ